MFDWKKPTVQMLGRFQPWHYGHQSLFKRCVAKTGQVVIQVRDVQGSSGGEGPEELGEGLEGSLGSDGHREQAADGRDPVRAWDLRFQDDHLRLDAYLRVLADHLHDILVHGP